ncbi:MAG: hypothetical protein KGK08_06865 [Acidobacteriota bacterium]|nr:hypothetical protein [Acidobacteriota bacterium]
MSTSAGLHAAAFVALLLLRYVPVRVERMRVANELPQISEAAILPELTRAGAEGTSGQAHRATRAGRFHPQSNARNQTYFGPQHIVSNPEKPDNTLQTILQPDLQAAKIAAPLPVPNMVKVAMPKSLVLPPVPRQTQTRMAVPTGEVATQEVSANTLLSAAPTPVMPALPQRDAPKLPVPVHATVAPEPLRAKAPEPKVETPHPAGAPPVPTKPTEEKPVAKPVQTAQQVGPTVQGAGHDDRNLLVINAVKQPSQAPPKELPKGELRGAFEVVPSLDAQRTRQAAGASSAEAVTHGSGSAKESKRSTDGTANASGDASSAAGSGKLKASASGGNSTTAGNGPGVGRQGSSTGNGASAGDQHGAFPNVTVEAANVPSVGTPAQARIVERESYGMTIVGGAGSGGGLRDYGVFRDGTSYTNYMDMTSLGVVGGRWILQYGISNSDRAMHSPGAFAPPYALLKMLPSLQPTVVSSNLGRMIVVQGEITTDGVLESMRVLQSPDSRVSAQVLQCLAQWKFQPASIGKDSVRVKVLLGIPIVRNMATGASGQ